MSPPRPMLRTGFKPKYHHHARYLSAVSRTCRIKLDKLHDILRAIEQRLYEEHSIVLELPKTKRILSTCRLSLSLFVFFLLMLSLLLPHLSHNGRWECVVVSQVLGGVREVR